MNRQDKFALLLGATIVASGFAALHGVGYLLMAFK